MGVPKFYRWISERYPCLSETVKDHQMPEFDNLYLDMNGIVHVCSHPDDGNAHFRITEEKIFADIFHYLEVLFRMIKPKKVFFMAIDGVAPRAKMNQQRGRRFRSAKEAENLEKKAVQRGETLPSEARFDSNCITPGTEFMVRLHEQLKYFVVSKLSNDKLWQGVSVYLSGHETPGEGEHKIMDFIRSEKARSDYDPNTRHCLYGLDADLIMLGLTTHEPHFALLREEVRFGKQTQKRSTTVEETTFHLLHISLLREYLDLEFASVKQSLISLEYNLERIIDDWVLMGFLVGNDFIPHLPHMHIAQDALPTIWKTYKQMLPIMGGYLNDKGKINMVRLEQFLVALAEYDMEKFSDSYADIKWVEGKSTKGKARNSAAPAATLGVETTSAVDEIDDFGLVPFENGEQIDESEIARPYVPTRLADEDSLSYEFKKHKSNYYFDKMGLQATPEVLAQQARDYVLGLQWILYYYFTGVPSWSWYFPHHYAPYLSDLHSFHDIEIVLEPGTPFLPFQQLMAVLPGASSKLLPAVYQKLMLTDSSPIIDFYPEEFELDLNGKQQDWEAVVLISFIDEKRLLEAMSSVEKKLTASERDRNIHGPCIIYQYTSESQGVFPSTLQGFPDIAQNHTKTTLKNWEDFVVSAEQLNAGLCVGVKPTLYYPGFPTFTHIKHNSYLQKLGVTVFQQASRGENRIVTLIDEMEVEDVDIMELGQQLLGKSIWVNWPHLFEAKVCVLENDEWKVEFDRKGKEVVKSPVDDTGRVVWQTVEQSLSERYMKKRGIDAGPTYFIIQAKPITGRKYVYLNDGRVTVEKEWQPTPAPFLLQACVKNDTMLKFGVESAGSIQFFELKDIFPVGCQVYVLAHPYYGFLAKVVNHVEDRVRVKVNIAAEPDLSTALKFNKHARYMKAYEVAQQLGVSSHFVSRITGMMFISKGKENINIGLDLKNNKKNEECPGFTRKDNGDWLYSQATVDVIYSYLEKFPDFSGYIHENLNKDRFQADNIFTEDRDSQCAELVKFVRSLPTYKCHRAKCGGLFLEAPTIEKIEQLVSNKPPDGADGTHTIIIKPALIYKQYSMTSTMIPDPSADFQLFDRVVNVRLGFTVPYSLKGTVVGVILGDDPRDTMVEVVFDEEFACGLSIRCSPGKGYRCPPHALLNISYGMRMAAEKGLKNSQSGKSKTGGAAVKQQQSSQSRNAAAKSYSSAASVGGKAGKSANDSELLNKNVSNNSRVQTPVKILKKSDIKSRQNVVLSNGGDKRASSESPSYGKAAFKPRVVENSAIKQQTANQKETAKPTKPESAVTKKQKRDKAATGQSKLMAAEVTDKVAADASSKAQPQLMSPSEFVTPKVNKVDGRRKSGEKSSHTDIWAKLKAADKKKEDRSIPAASSAANAEQDMAQAAAALKLLNISSPSPKTPSVTIEPIRLMTPGSISSVPQPGDKIDLESLLKGGGESTTLNSDPSRKPKIAKPSRIIYKAGQLKTSPSNADSSKTKQSTKELTATDSSGGFNFESLVSALEKNMAPLPVVPQGERDVLKAGDGGVLEKDVLVTGQTIPAHLDEKSEQDSKAAPANSQALHTPASMAAGSVASSLPVPGSLASSVLGQPLLLQPPHRMQIPPQPQVPQQIPGYPQQMGMRMNFPVPPSVVLERWASSVGIPIPNYHSRIVAHQPSGPVYVVMVHVGQLRFEGLPNGSHIYAVQSAADIALKGCRVDPRLYQHQPMGPRLATPVQTPQLSSSPVNHQQQQISTSKSATSSFVPLQVTRNHVQERERTDSGSSASALDMSNHADGSSVNVEKATSTTNIDDSPVLDNSTGGVVTKKNDTIKNKVLSNKPRKSKSRLAANFDIHQ